MLKKAVRFIKHFSFFVFKRRSSVSQHMSSLSPWRCLVRKIQTAKTLVMTVARRPTSCLSYGYTIEDQRIVETAKKLVRSTVVWQITALYYVHYLRLVTFLYILWKNVSGLASKLVYRKPFPIYVVYLIKVQYRIIYFSH